MTYYIFDKKKVYKLRVFMNKKNCYCGSDLRNVTIKDLKLVRLMTEEFIRARDDREELEVLERYIANALVSDRTCLTFAKEINHQMLYLLGKSSEKSTIRIDVKKRFDKNTDFISAGYSYNNKQKIDVKKMGIIPLFLLGVIIGFCCSFILLPVHFIAITCLVGLGLVYSAELY